MKRITITLGLLLSLCVLVGMWGLPSRAAAATETITVESTGDATNSAADCPGANCTLRDALDLAANDGPGDTIDLPAGPITLTQGQLEITLPVTIQGYSATQPTEIKQTTSDARVILLAIGEAGDSGGQYNLNDLELTGGNLTDGISRGAGLNAADTGDPAAAVNFNNDVIEDNTAAPVSPAAMPAPVFGAGLLLSGDDTYSLTDTAVQDNTLIGASAAENTGSSSGAGGGEAEGAGITYSASGFGLLLLKGSRVESNTATGGAGAQAASGSGGPGAGGGADGGGMYLAGLTTLVDTQIVNNAVNGGIGGKGSSGGFDGSGGAVGGGGIDADAGLTLGGGDSVDENTATVNDDSLSPPDALGAGIEIHDPNSSITASSIYANVASGGADSVGGIFVAASGSMRMLTLTNSTVATNEATGAGDAIGGLSLTGVTHAEFDTIAQNEGATVANVDASAPADGVFSDSIIAGASGGGPNCTALTDNDDNLEDDAADSCGFSASDGSLVGANPALGKLAVNDPNDAEYQASSTDIDTLLPGTTSAALNLVPSCGGADTDARDLPRPSSGPCDAGAVQVQLARNVDAPDLYPSTVDPGGSVSCATEVWTPGDSPSISSYVVEFLSGATVVNTQSVPPSSTTDPVASYTTTAAEANSQISCEVAAVTAYGQSAFVTAPEQATVGSNPSSPGPSSPQSTTPKPMLSDLTQTHKTWRPAKLKATAKTRHDPVGTTFHYDASQTGRVTLTLLVQTRGVKHGHSCVAGKAKRKQKTCLRWVRYATVGTYPVTLPGPQMISFNGRVHGHALATGAYEAQVTEVASGGASDLLTIAFRVVH